MMPLNEIIEKLSDRNLAEVSRRLLITRSYLSAIVNQKRTPSKEFQQRLSDYLQE